PASLFLSPPPTPRSSPLSLPPLFRSTVGDPFGRRGGPHANPRVRRGGCVARLGAFFARALVGGQGYVSGRLVRVRDRDRSPVSLDRKSKRLNSSHGSISYAVFFF